MQLIEDSLKKIRDVCGNLQSTLSLFASGAQGHIVSNANTLLKLPKTVFIEFTKCKKLGYNYFEDKLSLRHWMKIQNTIREQ